MERRYCRGMSGSDGSSTIWSERIDLDVELETQTCPSGKGQTSARNFCTPVAAMQQFNAALR